MNNDCKGAKDKDHQNEKHAKEVQNCMVLLRGDGKYG